MNTVTKRPRIKMRNLKRTACILGASAVMLAFAGSVSAAEGGAGVVTSNFRSFYDIVAALASAVGSILLLWNVVEWGITLNSQEGMMQARAFKGIGGALVMILAPQIISGFVF
ncbi:MAG: hypothetical protein J5973_08205 [Eubacterium sp.]|nr:hypothetical protein [Eubacterium sp.]